MSDQKDDAILQAELGMVQKELERKTGNYSKKTSRSKFDQQEFLNRMRKNKKQKEKLNYDVKRLNKTYKYPDDIDPKVALKVIKEKLWKENRNVNLINLEMVANMKLEKYSSARVNYKKGKFIDEDNKNLCYNIIELNFLEGNIEEAYKIMKKRIERNNDTENLYLFSLILYVMGDFKEVLKNLIIALKKDKSSERAYRYYVFFTLLKEEKSQDPEMVIKFLEKNPSDVKIRLVLNEIYLDANRLELAKNQNDLLKNYNQNDKFTPCVLTNEAKYFRKKGDMQNAIAKTKQAIKYNPLCICSKVERAKVYIDQKDYKKAYSIVEEDFKKYPRNLFILNEFLRVNFYLEEKERVNKMAQIILDLQKNIKLKLYNKDKDILGLRVEDIKDKFYSKLKVLLNKHKGLDPSFSLVFNNNKMTWKLFRDYRICEKINNKKK